MKTYKKTYLPEFIVHKHTLLRYNGALSGRNTPPKIIIKELKKDNRIAVAVEVLSARLKGKTDLHNKPYKPTLFIYSN